MRIVFDAAAEFEGTSLNKNLLHGPDMTNNLIGVLMRFRQGKVGVAADVEGMFHQIRVRKEDQDSLRFLWWTKSFEALQMSTYASAHFWSCIIPLCRQLFSSASRQ